VLSTVHPSSILRAQDDEAREEAFAGFVADLVKAREAWPPDHAADREDSGTSRSRSVNARHSSR
jgi:hypothetical protein